MALKATIYKAELSIADMDRNYYETHQLTLARHPSETDERMMVRLLAFARHANDALAFGKGLSSEDEPDLWQKDLTGVIDVWIDVGQPDEKRIRRACGRAGQVVVYTYGGRGADLWWGQTAEKVERATNLTVVNLSRSSHSATCNCSAAFRTRISGCPTRSVRSRSTPSSGERRRPARRALK